MNAEVLLTRPKGENEKLAKRLTKSGWEVIIRPMVKIEKREASKIEVNIVDRFESFDKVVFVSKNAVRCFIPMIKEKLESLPSSLKWVAIGKGTADELEKSNISAEFPETAGTESLLEMEVFKHLKRNKILIVRGQGGRELLAKRLSELGAEVRYLEAYRRKPVHYRNSKKISAHTVLTSTSLEILQSLIPNLSGSLEDYSLVVPSLRIAKRAEQFCFSKVLNSDGASDQKLYSAIMSMRESLT